MTIRISEDPDETLDEFYSDEVRSVHFEAMDTNRWWIGVVLADGRTVHIHCGAVNPRTKAYAQVLDIDPPRDA